MSLTSTTPGVAVPAASDPKQSLAIQRLFLLSVCLVATAGWLYLLWIGTTRLAQSF